MKRRSLRQEVSPQSCSPVSNWALRSPAWPGVQLRMRMFTFEPGAVFGPMHDHKDRPGIVYVLHGTITDHRDGAATDYGPGVGWPEDRNTMHCSRTEERFRRWRSQSTSPNLRSMARAATARVPESTNPEQVKDGAWSLELGGGCGDPAHRARDHRSCDMAGRVRQLRRSESRRWSPRRVSSNRSMTRRTSSSTLTLRPPKLPRSSGASWRPSFGLPRRIHRALPVHPRPGCSSRWTDDT